MDLWKMLVAKAHAVLARILCVAASGLVLGSCWRPAWRWRGAVVKRKTRRQYLPPTDTSTTKVKHAAVGPWPAANLAKDQTQNASHGLFTFLLVGAANPTTGGKGRNDGKTGMPGLDAGPDTLQALVN